MHSHSIVFRPSSLNNKSQEAWRRDESFVSLDDASILNGFESSTRKSYIRSIEKAQKRKYDERNNIRHFFLMITTSSTFT